MSIHRASAVVITRVVADRCYTRAFVLPPNAAPIPFDLQGDLRPLVGPAEYARSVHDAVADETRNYISGMHFFTI
jgi:hypothetical protein